MFATVYAHWVLPPLWVNDYVACALDFSLE